jgi:multisubunit Na+/H+ antiporter MnhB subunit
MKRITGIVSFLGGVIGVILMLRIFITELVPQDEFDEWEYTGLFFWGLTLLSMLSVVYYTLSNRFWTTKAEPLEALTTENEIIKKKIERQELLVKLEQLEKK